MKKPLFIMLIASFSALVTFAFSSKKIEPKTKALKKMDIQNFHFIKFQSETGRDSNGQLEHVKYNSDDGLMRVYDEWTGYHPGPGGGKQSDTQYFMTEEALTKIYDFLKENGLDKESQSTPSTGPDSGLGIPEYRTYGASFGFQMKSGETILHKFSYDTGGPRDAEKDKDPLNQKLMKLQELLKELQYGELGGTKALKRREKTKEDIENEMHERMYGHFPGEKPKVLQRFRFTKKDEEFGAKKPSYSSSNYVYPVYALDFQYNEIRVTYYSQGGAKEPSDIFYGKLPDETIQKMLALFIEHNFYGKEMNSHYLSPKELVAGDRKITYEIELHFGSRWMRKTEYNITYHKGRELEKPTKENKAIIANAEALEKALLALVESSEIQSKKKAK